MYVSVTSHKIETGKSCQKLVDYLEKENKYKQDKELFFGNKGEEESREVVAQIDANVKKLRLKDKEARYYNVLVAPSSCELQTIKNNPLKLKDYARDVMQQYAESFNRLNADGTPLSADDLVWYAKLEEKKTFTDRDRVVKHNEKYEALEKCYESWLRKEKLSGVSKDGLQQSDMLKAKLEEMGGVYVVDGKGKVKQTVKLFHDEVLIKRGLDRPEKNQSHIHIIVSRAHKTERMSLSPMANNRGGKNVLNGEQVSIGFNRMEFSKKCEVLYDLKFDHKREYSQSIDSKPFKGNYSGKGWDKYTNQVVEKASNTFGKQSGQKMPVGYNQLNKFMFDAMCSDGLDDAGKLKQSLDKYIEQYYPKTVMKAMERKVDSVKNMEFLKMFNSVNLPTKVVKEVVNTMNKALTSGYYIGG